MARTRKTSKEALEEKIEKAEADVIAAKKKYDQATANLKELLDKRDAIRKEEILSAVVKNEWQSYEEIMNFLNVGSDGEKKEKQNYFESQIQRHSIQAKKLDVHNKISIDIKKLKPYNSQATNGQQPNYYMALLQYGY